MQMKMQNLAYAKSLIARYKDQVQQMKLAVLKGNSIGLLKRSGGSSSIFK